MDDGTNLSDIEGEEWDKWIEILGRELPEEDEMSEGDEPKPEPLAECKKLPVEDMTLFGFCPEMDGFYGVVCEQCDCLVKPQFVLDHMQLRHTCADTLKSSVKSNREDVRALNNNNSNTNNNVNTVVSSSKSRKSTSATSKENTPLQLHKKSDSKHSYVNHVDKNAAVVRNQQSASSSVVSSSKSAERRHTPSSSHKEAKHVSSASSAVHAVTKCSEKNIATPSLKHIDTVKVKCIPNTTLSSKSNHTKGESLLQVNLVEPESCTKKKRKAPTQKEKVYSPDIHCGVWNEQTKKNCMRALTCRTHSLLLKRAVPMRSKLFDMLLADHRALNKAKKEREDSNPLYVQTSAPTEPALIESSLKEILACIAKNRFTSGMTFALHGSMASRLVYSWRIPELTTPVTLHNSRHSHLNLKPLTEPALPGTTLPAEPTRLPQLKTIFPKPCLKLAVPKREHVSSSESLFASVHPKPLSVCPLGLQRDGGYLGPKRLMTPLRSVVKTAFDDTYRFAAPLSTDRFGLPMIGPNYSNIKAVLSSICGRAAAQRSANQRNTKVHAKSSHSSKSSGTKNVPKNATLVLKTFPVGTQTSLTKDSTQHSKITSVHTYTIVGTNMKTQPKANLKRLAGESFKENDVVKSPRKSNPVISPAELFSKATHHGGHVVAVAYSNGGKAEGSGSSLLRNSDRSEHGPGESLLVSNRTVGLLAARPHSSIGDTLPQLPTAITANSLAALTEPPESHRNKAKGSSLIRITDGKGKVSTQPVTCITTGQTTMMTLQQVLGPQVITQVQVAPKGSSGASLKFIPQAQTVSLANTKTFLLKKDHGET